MKQLLLLSLVGLLFLSGCTHYYYLPNSFQIPRLQERNDAVVSVGWCELKGWEAQAVYSPVKHGYVMFNHLNIPRYPKPKDIESGKGALTEFGAGGYWGDGVWCLSLGAGLGKGLVQNRYWVDSLLDFVTNEHVYDTLESTMRFRRKFVQPGLSFEHKWFFGGAALRFVWLDYNTLYADPKLFYKKPNEWSAIQSITRETSLNFTELGLTFGVKYGPVQLSCDYTRIGLAKQKVEELNFYKYNYAIRLSLNIHKLWQKE